jgi:hypothetical protein
MRRAQLLLTAWASHTRAEGTPTPGQLAELSSLLRLQHMSPFFLAEAGGRVYLSFVQAEGLRVRGFRRPVPRAEG